MADSEGTRDVVVMSFERPVHGGGSEAAREAVSSRRSALDPSAALRLQARLTEESATRLHASDVEEAREVLDAGPQETTLDAASRVMSERAELERLLGFARRRIDALEQMLAAGDEHFAKLQMWFASAREHLEEAARVHGAWRAAPEEDAIAVSADGPL